MKVDGSEDRKVHCLKDGEIAASAMLAIVEATFQLQEEDDTDGDDPFASLGEEDEQIMQKGLVIDESD